MVLQGIFGIPIDIEIDTQPGIPCFTIVGLWDASIQESRERIRSAIKNSKCSFPLRRITINLAPAHIKKTGSHFDLAIALGLTIDEDSNLETKKRLESTLILWELALDGKLRPLVGALPFIVSAKKQGIQKVMLPRENMPEVLRIPDIEILPVESLLEGIEYFEKGEIRSYEAVTAPESNAVVSVKFESIIGQESVKRGLIIAASWGHNVLLEWPPGSGKSMLCSALQWILPDLQSDEELEVSQIYSILGLGQQIRSTLRPFRHVHHTASIASIIWWWKHCRPWEISLAHHGVLFMDEILEFDRSAIESLREPLESREIRISRAYGTYAYPASFMLVGAMNPCPCGYLWDTIQACKDTASEISKYRGKLSWPILDRIDLFLQVPRPRLEEIKKQNSSNALTTECAKQKVSEASQIAMQRQGKLNANLRPHELDKLEIEEEAHQLLLRAIEQLSLSLRAYHRLLRVSRTIADLENHKKIAPAHVAEAMWYRQN